MSKLQLGLKQLNLFFVALGFLTRLPSPSWVEFNNDNLNQSSRYFALVGLVIGLFSAFIFWLCQLILPASVAVLITMLIGVIVTGVMNEDGLGDTADGFGGGKTIEDKLRIMKDSRLGSYGAISIFLALLLKWQMLVELALYSPMAAVSGFIVAHTLSRVVSASLIFSEKFVQGEVSQSQKPLVRQQSLDDLFILLATGILALIWLNGFAAFALFILLWLLRMIIGRVFRRQIGGYNSATLGAAQQISELACYLVILTFGV